MHLKHISRFAAFAALTVACAGQAFAATVTWKGQVWDAPTNGTAVINADGSLTLNRAGLDTADVQVHINRIAPVVAGESLVNANGTPWVKVTYVDNGASRGVDFFIDDEITAGNPRIQAGSLFSLPFLGYTRYTDGSSVIEDPLGVIGTRVAGQVHTIYVSKRADGTVNFNYDDQGFTSTLLLDHVGPFSFNDVYLRLRGNFGTTATFIDFQAGDSFTIDINGTDPGGEVNIPNIFNVAGDSSIQDLVNDILASQPKNHGKFVSEISKLAKNLHKGHFLTGGQAAELKKAAARSDVGKK